jgi:hypothetical protein
MNLAVKIIIYKYFIFNVCIQNFKEMSDDV